LALLLSNAFAAGARWLVAIRLLNRIAIQPSQHFRAAPTAKAGMVR
jgi:hypothetical protein